MQQICEKHLRYICSICLDNSCKSKLLCEECQKTTSEHDNHQVVEYVTFLRNLQAFIDGQPPNYTVHGANFDTKKRLYLYQTDSLRQELKSTHLHKLEEGCDKYIAQLSDGLIRAKQTMVDFVKEAADICFSQQILNNRQSLRYVSQILLDTLSTRISTRQANSLFIKLHTGELEREHQEEKIKGLVNLFSYQMQYILDPLASQVNKYLTRFYKEVENLKDKIRQENFQSNQSNMSLQKPLFKIEDLSLDQNQNLRVKPPQSIVDIQYRRQTYSPKFKHSSQSFMPTESLDSLIETQLKQTPIIKLNKQQIHNLLKTLDYTSNNKIKNRKAYMSPNFRISTKTNVQVELSTIQ